MTALCGTAFPSDSKRRDAEKKKTKQTQENASQVCEQAAGPAGGARARCHPGLAWPPRLLLPSLRPPQRSLPRAALRLSARDNLMEPLQSSPHRRVGRQAPTAHTKGLEGAADPPKLKRNSVESGQKALNYSTMSCALSMTTAQEATEPTTLREGQVADTLSTVGSGPLHQLQLLLPGQLTQATPCYLQHPQGPGLGPVPRPGVHSWHVTTQILCEDLSISC